MRNPWGRLVWIANENLSRTTCIFCGGQLDEHHRPGCPMKLYQDGEYERVAREAIAMEADLRRHREQQP